jgi:hypothetical protein
MESGVESRKKNFIVTLEKKRTPDGLFIFKNCYDSTDSSGESGNEITSDSFFYIVHEKSELCLALDLTSMSNKFLIIPDAPVYEN